MIDFKREAQQILDKAIRLRRDFHMHPEPSQKEFRTADIVAKHLESLGMDVRRDYADDWPSAVAVLQGASPGPTVALRADMDALGIQEMSTHAYKSTVSGVMHACGHDCHTAILMCAAEVLAAHRQEMKGSVKFIFEPSEESVGGAKAMVKNGVLEGVDAIFALHMDTAYQAGQMAFVYGPAFAVGDVLEIKIKGKAVHGAYPHLGVDAIMIASHFLAALQTMMAREKDTLAPAIATFGTITGGEARNVICDEVILRGITRTFDVELQEKIARRLEELLQNITTAFGGGYELNRRANSTMLFNDHAMADFVKETALSLMRPEDCIIAKHPTMGGESFAYFAEKIPAVMYWLGGGNTAKGLTEPLHSSTFDVDESSLATGIALQAAIAWNFLEKQPRSTRFP